MKTLFQVLSENERCRVHEASLAILETTGVRVETGIGRNILKKVGAIVDEADKIVKFPKNLVESSLKLLTGDFTLSARRPKADLVMNNGDSTYCLDGDGTMVLDRETGERRMATYADWKDVTRMADAIDEIGMYWLQVFPGSKGETIADFTGYACDIFRNFSKHVQDGTSSAEQAPWYTEILQAVFGTKEEIRKNHPVSYLLCPQSPLIIDKQYTEAYLALKGWNIPVGIMPMPLMGATAPGNMISTIIQGNCEVLSMICLLQANEPGVPIIYAPALAAMNPKTGSLRDASMEYSVMSAAATEMARYYNIPAGSSPGGSDAHILDFQDAYEGAAMTIPTILSWPDIIYGTGMLDGSMVSSLEQTLIDVEVFRLAKHAHRGVNTDDDMWLTDVIQNVGPGGNYLCERSTLNAVRSDEWYMSDLGTHESYDNWNAAGRKDLLEEAREKVDHILETHEPMPLCDDVEKELENICKRAKELS